MRLLSFAAGVICGVYLAAYLLEYLFPDPLPETRTAPDGRVWWWSETPAT